MLNFLVQTAKSLAAVIKGDNALDTTSGVPPLIVEAALVRPSDPEAFRAEMRKDLLTKLGVAGKVTTEAELLREAEDLAVKAFGFEIIYEHCPHVVGMALEVEGHRSIYCHNKLRPAAKAFVIMHEVGHLHLRHKSVLGALVNWETMTEVEREPFLRQERETNVFALTWLELKGAVVTLPQDGDLGKKWLEKGSIKLLEAPK